MSIVNLAVAVQSYDSANTIRTEAGQLIIAGFKGLDFVAFTAQQSAIVAELVTAKLSDNMDSAKRMLLRTMEGLGIEKPKAIGAASAKADKRESAKAEAVKLVTAAGVTEKSTAQEILALAGKATGVAQQALTNAAMLKSKIDEKATAKAFTALKDETAKAVKLTDSATLAKIRKILGLK